jgi:hypothetical protein
MTEKNITEEAQDLLDGVADLLPLRVIELTNPDVDDVLARINSANGYPVLKPSPEAQALLEGKRAVFELFVFAPRIIQGLLDLIESNKSTPEEAKPVQNRSSGARNTQTSRNNA